MGERQFFAGGDQNLLTDQVHAGDAFRYRVFDLNARVHLHEINFFRRITDEFNRAGIAVARRLCGLHGSGAKGVTLGLI